MDATNGAEEATRCPLRSVHLIEFPFATKWRIVVEIYSRILTKALSLHHECHEIDISHSADGIALSRPCWSTILPIISGQIVPVPRKKYSRPE